MESLWLLPILFLFFVLNVGQVFRLYMHYDLRQNCGFVALKFWCFRLKKFSFELKSEGIILRTKKQKNQIEYKFSDPKIKFYEELSRQLEDKTKLKNLNIKMNIGLSSAGQTASAVGTAEILLNILFAYLKNIKPTASVTVQAVPFWLQKKFEFFVFAKISLSFFDFIYSLIFAFCRQKNT